MRTMSLPKGEPSLGTDRASMSDIPSPLHIIKRTKTVEFRPKANRDTSSGSTDCGPDQPLSVMKKRQHHSLVGEAASSAHVSENQDTAGTQSSLRVGALVPRLECFPLTEKRPKPQARPRWFSRQRTSSSGTTRRRYSLRGSSISSDESSNAQSSNLRFVDETSTLDSFDTHDSARADSSLSSIPTSTDYGDDCHLLVPRISVTPEVQVCSNAVSTVWATIEISVQLSRPYIDGMPHSYPNANCLLPNPPRVGSVSRFGYLYNLQVDVLPVPQAAVIEVIRGDEWRNLTLGSSMLLLAKIQVDRRRSRRPDRSATQTSDELIADLESELGAPGIRYLQVRLRYHHSGFLAPDNLAPTDGTVECRTWLETTATGVIEQRALCVSPGLSPLGTGDSSLFGIVASYWGPFHANEIFRQRASHQPNPLAAANTALANRNSITAIEDCFDYQQPLTAAGLGDPFTPVPRRRAGIPPPSPQDDGEDPARKIWTEMRRRTSRSDRQRTAKNSPSTPVVSTANGGTGAAGSPRAKKIKSGVDQRRELIQDTALRNKRSIGADSLKSLVPSIVSLDIGGREVWGGGNGGGSPPDALNKENVPPERRKEGRWNLGGWW